MNDELEDVIEGLCLKSAKELGGAIQKLLRDEDDPHCALFQQADYTWRQDEETIFQVRVSFTGWDAPERREQ